MNDILKQRLVGAVVIIVLGVIFWPIVFVTPELEPLDRGSQVPAIPTLERRELPAPQPLEGLPKAVYAEEVVVPKASAPAVAVISSNKVSNKPASSEKTKPALDDNGIPVAWTLQVVTYGSREKADKLVIRLIAMDYKAYIKSLRRDSKTLYRVYIGPKFDREDMLQAKAVIDRELRVTSMVTRYLP